MRSGPEVARSECNFPTGNFDIAGLSNTVYVEYSLRRLSLYLSRLERGEHQLFFSFFLFTVHDRLTRENSEVKKRTIRFAWPDLCERLYHSTKFKVRLTRKRFEWPLT